VVRAILRLADVLELPVVAEGIETADQERFLLEHGCSIGQGFRYSRPVPADQLRTMLGTAMGVARR
jgi:EAL domain-containing protein (putative c-di-GMP-specific phosphodiesterase class I)